MADLTFDWPETVGLLFLIIGFVMAMLAGNVYVLYSVCFLIGLIFGRILYRFRMSECIPIFIVIMAFFLGFILGGIYANLRIIALLLLAGILISYWLHDKRIIRSIEY